MKFEHRLTNVATDLNIANLLTTTSDLIINFYIYTDGNNESQ